MGNKKKVEFKFVATQLTPSKIHISSFFKILSEQVSKLSVKGRTKKLRFDPNPHEYSVIAVEWVECCDKPVYVLFTVGADTKQPILFKLSLRELNKNSAFFAS